MRPNDSPCRTSSSPLAPTVQSREAPRCAPASAYGHSSPVPDHCRPRLSSRVPGDGDVVRQSDSFPPPCPMNFRPMSFPRNNKLHQAYSSHQILVGQAASRMRSLLKKRDFCKGKSFDKNVRKSSRSGGSGHILVPFRPIAAGRPDGVRACVGSRRFSEMTMAMPFIARWMDLSDADLDNKFTDRITLIFPSYSCQE